MKRTTVFILASFFLLCSLAPTFYELSVMNQLPQNRFFELVHNYVTDYHFYLSRVRQGWEGNWTLVERYTSEPHQGSYIQVLYLWLGQLSRMIADPVFAMAGAYHVSRILFGFLLLILVAQLVKRCFKATLWQVLAFLLVVTACTWPKIVTVGNTWRFGGYMAWWTIMDNLQRITFIPHILVGQCLIVFLLLSGSSRETLGRKGNWVFLGVLALLLAIVFPPGYMFVGVVFGVLSLFELFWEKDKWSAMWPRFGIILLGLPGLLYFQYMFGLMPWNRLIEIDTIRVVPFRFYEYAQALGPMLPLGFIGMIIAFVRKEKMLLVCTSWVISWIVLLFIFQFIPSQNPSRFSEMAPQIPLGILTAYTFFQISNFKFQISNFQKFAPTLKFIGVFLPISLITLGLGVMYSSWLWQRDFIDMKVHAGYPQLPMNNYIVYPAKDVMDSVFFLGSRPSPATVLSGFAIGNLIPAYSDKTVYVGHDNTVDGEGKLIEMKQFFRGALTPQEALEFVQKASIDYVIIGPEEKEIGKGMDIGALYPFLTNPTVFGGVTVYKISSL